ncbi:MAG: hydroxymethylglutaryl-CoA lyase, partial [Candidatus Limnocylindrales bacterium]
MVLPDQVRIYEVGPRDGLQNESALVPTDTKRRFIERLVAAGLREVEATSFVSPRAIPQLADADELLPTLPREGATEDVRYPVLVANQQGLERAEAAGATAMAVFTAASDAFTAHNIGMTVAESLSTFAPLVKQAAQAGWWRRGYVSTAFGCPYIGRVEPARAAAVGLALLDLGVDEVCFGDTIGVGVPGQVAALTGLAVEAGVPLERIAFHFHDTRGTALANVSAGLDA